MTFLLGRRRVILFGMVSRLTSFVMVSFTLAAPTAAIVATPMSLGELDELFLQVGSVV